MRTTISLILILAGLGDTAAEAQSLGTTNRLEGPAAGSDSVVLAMPSATSSWTATANATWLHFLPANQGGAGSTNLVFSYDANSGATRSGSITVAGQMLTVTQVGSVIKCLRKRFKKRPAEALVNLSVNRAQPLDLRGIGIKTSNESITQARTALLEDQPISSGDCTPTWLLGKGLFQ